MEGLASPLPSTSPALSSPMPSLPDELWVHIMSMLDLRTFASALPLVCRRWHDLSLDDSLWRSFLLSSTSHTRSSSNITPPSDYSSSSHLERSRDDKGLPCDFDVLRMREEEILRFVHRETSRSSHAATEPLPLQDSEGSNLKECRLEDLKPEWESIGRREKETGKGDRQRTKTGSEGKVIPGDPSLPQGEGGKGMSWKETTAKLAVLRTNARSGKCTELKVGRYARPIMCVRINAAKSLLYTGYVLF